MTPDQWVPLLLQFLGIMTMLGMHIQSHREYGRRIEALEKEKLDAALFSIHQEKWEDLHRQHTANIRELEVSDRRKREDV